MTDLLVQLGSDDAGRWVDEHAPLTDPRDLERPTDRAKVVVESTGAINFDPEFASFAARAGGWLIDTVATTLALLPGAALIVAGSGIVRLLGVLLVVLAIVGVGWSYTVSVAARGQWIGNRIVSTTVVNVSSGELIDRPHACARFVIRASLSPLLMAGFIVALTNSSRRTFHDQVAESVVIRPSRASWSIDDETA